MSLMIVDSARFGVPNGFYEFPLTNPGAETGDTTGWTASNPTQFASINTTGGDWVGPKSGSRYFTFGTAAAGSTAYQDVAVPVEHQATVDTGMVAFWMSVWRSSFGGERSRHTIIAYDASMVELARMVPLDYTSANVVWVQRSNFLRLPTGTRIVRIIIEAITKDSSYLDAYFDDVRCWLDNYTGAITDYANAGGTGNRTASITVTASGLTTGGGALSNLVDGSQANAYWWQAGANNGTQFLKFDFGVGVTKTINQIRWYQDVLAYHGVWVLEGSNDDATWDTFGSGFTLGHGMFDVPNANPYRYYRLRALSGNRVTTPYNREIEFKIA